MDFGSFWYDKTNGNITDRVSGNTYTVTNYETAGRFSDINLAFSMFQSEFDDEFDNEVKNSSKTYWVRFILCISKIEIFGAIRLNDHSRNNSKRKFCEGYEVVFSSTGRQNLRNEALLLYTGVRCGYFHSGMISRGESTLDFEIHPGKSVHSVNISQEIMSIYVDQFIDEFEFGYRNFLSGITASERNTILNLWANRWG